MQVWSHGRHRKQIITWEEEGITVMHETIVEILVKERGVLGVHKVIKAIKKEEHASG